MNDEKRRIIKKRLEDMEIVAIEDASSLEDVEAALDAIEEYEKEFSDEYILDCINTIKEAKELGIVDIDAHLYNGDQKKGLETLKLAIKLQKEHGQRIYDECEKRRALSNG